MTQKCKKVVGRGWVDPRSFPFVRSPRPTRNPELLPGWCHFGSSGWKPTEDPPSTAGRGPLGGWVAAGRSVVQ
eukprot:gene17450-biopygen2328